jgi:tellurite resistance protein
MGLLAKYFDGGVAAQSPADDVLLLHGMMCMAGADGSFDQAEVALLEAYFAQLPEFRGKDFDELVAEARKVVSTYHSTLESVEALGELSSPRVKSKMFVLAVELALAGGSLDEREDAMLESMQRVLGIDPSTAAKVVEVVSMKYARA